MFKNARLFDISLLLVFWCRFLPFALSFVSNEKTGLKIERGLAHRRHVSPTERELCCDVL